MEMFDKSVAPGYTCDEYGNNCAWVNKVGRVIISARESYGIQPPIAPTDPTHQLLFHLNGIAAMTNRCLSFEIIRSLMPAPPNDPLSYPLGAGPSASNWIAGVQWAPGYGQPGVYAYRHVIGSSPILAVAVGQTTSDATQYSQTIYQFAEAIDRPLYSPIVRAIYFDANVKQSDYVIYSPDFTDCASGLPEDRVLGDQLYGTTTVVLVMEVYQAIQLETQ
jgi:hypothetical protein